MIMVTPYTSRKAANRSQAGANRFTFRVDISPALLYSVSVSNIHAMQNAGSSDGIPSESRDSEGIQGSSQRLHGFIDMPLAAIVQVYIETFPGDIPELPFVPV
jgi:hypothetical protein